MLAVAADSIAANRKQASRNPTVRTLEFWQSFVARHFREDGKLLLTSPSYDQATGSVTPNTKTWTLGQHSHSLARYFHVLFCHVESFAIGIEGAQEAPGKVLCHHATFTYNYGGPTPQVVCSSISQQGPFANSDKVICRGKLWAYWGNSDKLESLEIAHDDFQYLLQRRGLEALFNPQSPPMTQSPKMNKSNAKRAQPRTQPDAPLVLKKDDFPSLDLSPYMMPENVQSYLEV